MLVEWYLVDFGLVLMVTGWRCLSSHQVRLLPTGTATRLSWMDGVDSSLSFGTMIGSKKRKRPEKSRGGAKGAAPYQLTRHWGEGGRSRAESLWRALHPEDLIRRAREQRRIHTSRKFDHPSSLLHRMNKKEKNGTTRMKLGG